jgi:hypothetical protein
VKMKNVATIDIDVYAIDERRVIAAKERDHL